MALTGIDRTGTCTTCWDCIGGITRLAITDRCNISSLTFNADREVTAVTMTGGGTGTWKLFVFDADDTATLSQTTEQISLRNKRTNVEIFAKFGCVTSAIHKEADEINGVCEPVFAVEKSNGDVVIVGMDGVDDGAGGFEGVTSIRSGEALASLLTGTAAEEDRLELTGTATHRRIAPMTNALDLDAIVAL